MAFGGGTWTAQNKQLPGAYINFVKASDFADNDSGRGVVAIPYALNKAPATVIEITASEFAMSCKTILGIEHDSFAAKPFREIFKHATKCIIYDLGTNGTASAAVTALEPYEFNILAVYTSTTADITTYITAVKAWRTAGIKRQAVVYNATTPDDEAIINVKTTVSDYENQFFVGDGSTTEFVVTEKPSTVTAVLVNGTTKTVTTDYTYNSTSGKVTFTSAPANKADIEVRYNNSPAHALVAWVSGSEAGCPVYASVANNIYDGEHTVVTNLTQSQLVTAMTSGEFVFHRVYGDVRVFEDINSLTTLTEEKGEEFKYNQTIRVIDAIANDIAKLFVTKYIGQIPNNASGRSSFWADVEKYMRNLETINAIEPFDSRTLTVERGESKRAIVVTLAITTIDTLSQLYMTVVVN